MYNSTKVKVQDQVKQISDDRSQNSGYLGNGWERVGIDWKEAQGSFLAWK